MRRTAFVGINMRVWSWLRTNAGGRPKTCKLNAIAIWSSARVSNAWERDLEWGIFLGNEEQYRISPEGERFIAEGAAHVRLASWLGKGWPRRWSIAGLRGWSATLGLRHGPDSYGRQQLGILDNGGNPDPAMPREWRRPSGCKALLLGKMMTVPKE